MLSWDEYDQSDNGMIIFQHYKSRSYYLFDQDYIQGSNWMDSVV